MWNNNASQSLHPPASSSALSAARCVSAALSAAASCISLGPSAAAAGVEGQNGFCSPAAASETHDGELTPQGDLLWSWNKVQVSVWLKIPLKQGEYKELLVVPCQQTKMTWYISAMLTMHLNAAACYAQHLYSIATKQFKYQSGYSRWGI